MNFGGLYGSFQEKLPYDILCLQFLLACRLHHAFLRNVLNRSRSIARSTGLILLYFFMAAGLIDSDRDTCAVLATYIWSDFKSGFITNDKKPQLVFESSS